MIFRYFISKKLSAITALTLIAGFVFSTSAPLYSQNRAQPAASSTAKPAAAATTPAPAATSAAVPKQAEPAPTGRETASTDAVRDELGPGGMEQIQIAVDSFNKGDVAGALEILNELYKANPKMNPPRLILASWFAQLRNQQAVRVSLEMATDETPNDPEAFIILAELSSSQGELTATELLVKQAESVLARYTANPERAKNLNIRLMNIKINVAQARKRWEEMQGILAALIKEQGESAELARRVGFTFFQKKEDDKARQWLAHADTLSEGKGLPADAIMAQLYLSRNDVEKAKASLAAAQKSYPGSPEVLSLAVLMAINDNDLEVAWANAQKLLAANPDSVDVMKTYANVALFRGDYATAEKVFQDAVQKVPADMDIANGLALALCEQESQEKKDAGVQYAAGNVQKQGNNRDYLATLGWVLFRAGNEVGAKQALQHSIADGQVNAATAYYLGAIAVKEGNNDQAKQLLQAAVDSKPPFIKRKAAQELLATLK